MSLASTTQEYQAVIDKCKVTFADKYRDYDTAWRILRLPAFTDQIMIKGMRIRAIQEKPKLVGEGVVTELVGMVNYAILALIQLRLKDDERLHIAYEEVERYYDEVVEEIMKLLGQKNHDYNEAWRSMRMISMVDIILMKLLRIKKIEDNEGRTYVSEGIGSGYQDIVNYAVFSLIQCGFGTRQEKHE